MADQIRYDLLTQQALRGVVRTVLVDTAKKGLPGDHHFYISFDTRAEGVHLSDRLRAQYPDEMTIVLQHQFWDLKVGDEEFEVGLSCAGGRGGLPGRCGAIKISVDPSVHSALQSEPVGEAGGVAAAAAPAKTQGEKEPAKPRRSGKGGAIRTVPSIPA